MANAPMPLITIRNNRVHTRTDTPLQRRDSGRNHDVVMPVLLGKMGGLQRMRAKFYRFVKILFASAAFKNLCQEQDDCLFG